MSIIHNKIEYDCECYAYCNKKTYIRTEQDNSGHTTFFFGDHDCPEIEVCLNDKDIGILGRLIDDL